MGTPYHLWVPHRARVIDLCMETVLEVVVLKYRWNEMPRPGWPEGQRCTCKYFIVQFKEAKMGN